ncbi:SDR family NAD(P)-dependent oxidoreductase [Allobranchiibius sp. CTAmp26]|uniref:SDR family NAD(P)-dependent oxidoreductase n=1 Tax=Allobranchiibius sp. CTAmp26 TaxID=2815214 RepID=UPI001AA0C8E2|nr:SDR family oxidoreductase [Allobranchiibius sp. CTAmp26]MBO1756947.1 SDR family oxidoreductase [Allobranchiibius sp. CTAmp26]
MSPEFADQTVLVTGATSGIGLAAARQFAACGAVVLVHGRDQERGREVVASITEAGGTARFVAADLADADDVKRLAAEAGPVDVLVNNAGIYVFAGTTETSAETFDRHMAVNARAPFLLTAALAPGMQQRGHGVVVNVSTVAVKHPAPGTAAYGASKAAVEALTRSWADEFGEGGVRVVGVSPGPTRTGGTAEFGAVLDGLGDATTLKRVAEAEEIAQVIVFAASPQAAYISGTVIDVDGGRSSAKAA